MRLVHLIGGLALLAAAAPACAQQAGITYDCDTAADNFSELVLPAPAGAFTVTGRVRLAKIAKINKYTPLTRLAIASAPPGPGQSAEAWAGFKLSALPAKALGMQNKTDKAVLQFLEWDEGADSKAKAHDPVGPLDYPESLAFTLAYDGSSVVAKLGDQEMRMAIAVKNPVVRLICSTGEFLYTDLRIEKAG